MDDIPPKGRHLIFLNHLCILSKEQDKKLVTREWYVLETRKDEDEREQLGIVECIRKHILPSIDLLLKVNGNISLLPHRCICGMRIEEHCLVQNHVTNYRIWIGNCCVKHINPDLYKLVSKTANCMNTIIENGVSYVGNKLNDETIQLASSRGVINENDVTFLKNIGRKTKLSNKQEQWLSNIKSKVVRQYCGTDAGLLEKSGINATSTCSCGKEKKPNFQKCWQCDQIDKGLGTLCQCGRTKKPQYSKCYVCYKNTGSQNLPK